MTTVRNAILTLIHNADEAGQLAEGLAVADFTADTVERTSLPMILRDGETVIADDRDAGELRAALHDAGWWLVMDDTGAHIVLLAQPD